MLEAHRPGGRDAQHGERGGTGARERPAWTQRRGADGVFDEQLGQPGREESEHEHREGREGVHREPGRERREHEQWPVPQVDRSRRCRPAAATDRAQERSGRAGPDDGERAGHRQHGRQARERGRSVVGPRRDRDRREPEPRRHRARGRGPRRRHAGQEPAGGELPHAGRRDEVRADRVRGREGDRVRAARRARGCARAATNVRRRRPSAANTSGHSEVELLLHRQRPVVAHGGRAVRRREVVHAARREVPVLHIERARADLGEELRPRGRGHDRDAWPRRRPPARTGPRAGSAALGAPRSRTARRGSHVRAPAGAPT